MLCRVASSMNIVVRLSNLPTAMQRSRSSIADVLAHKCIHDQLRPQLEHYSQSYNNMAAIRQQNPLEVINVAYVSAYDAVACTNCFLLKRRGLRFK